MEGRKGPRTIDQRKSELLKKSTARFSQNYTIGGKLKEGKRAPAKITLPRIDLKEISDE